MSTRVIGDVGVVEAPAGRDRLRDAAGVATDEAVAGASHLGRTSLLFAVAYALFIIGPAELGRGHFSLQPDMQWEDVLGLAVPLVLLPAYWFLVRQRGSAPSLDGATVVVFLLLGAVWVQGQGMHLAANSINNLVGADGSMPGAGLIDFYDEILSHYLWHFAAIGLIGLALFRQWRFPLGPVRSDARLAVAGGVIYGLTFFITVVEGATGMLGVPAAAFLASFAMLAARGSRSELRAQPVTTFVLVGHVLALVLFSAWFVYWGGSLPEFSDPRVGLF